MTDHEQAVAALRERREWMLRGATLALESVLDLLPLHTPIELAVRAARIVDAAIERGEAAQQRADAGRPRRLPVGAPMTPADSPLTPERWEWVLRENGCAVKTTTSWTPLVRDLTKEQAVAVVRALNNADADENAIRTRLAEVTKERDEARRLLEDYRVDDDMALTALRADHAAVVRALRTVEWIGPDWRKGMVTQNIVNSCPYCHALTMPGLHDERCVIHAALSSPLAAAVSDQEPTT